MPWCFPVLTNTGDDDPGDDDSLRATSSDLPSVVEDAERRRVSLELMRGWRESRAGPPFASEGDDDPGRVCSSTPERPLSK